MRASTKREAGAARASNAIAIATTRSTTKAARVAPATAAATDRSGLAATASPISAAPARTDAAR